MNILTKVYDFAGTFFLGVFNIVCSSTIIAVNIFVSFNHTLVLFRSVGWDGSIGLAATIGCELAFIQSSVNMMIHSLRRKRPSLSIVFVFTIGTGLIMWSNISSTLESPGYWMVCVLLGLVPPLMMWGSKGVLADSIMKKQLPEMKQPVELEKELIEEKLTNISVVGDGVDNPEGEVVKKFEVGNELVNEVKPKVEISRESTRSLAKDNPKEIVEPTYGTAQEVKLKMPESKKSQFEKLVNEPTQLVSQTGNKLRRGSRAKLMDEKAGELEKKLAEILKEESPELVIAKLIELPVPEEPTTPLEWAIHQFKEKKKFVGRPTLKKLAGCTDSEARKVAEQLKPLKELIS